MFSVRIPMHDKQGNNPFEADATGAIVSFLSIFAFFPSMAFFGFNTTTWVIVTIFVVGLVHFVTFFVGAVYKNLVKPEILREREKAESK